jgi:hypothetical protein
MAINDQYRPGASKFFAAQPGSSTGAPGSAVPGPEVSAGPVVGTPEISVPGASSQLAANRPTTDVMAGDTCAMSADSPVPASGDPLTGLSLAMVTETGAGQGSGHQPHPNSMSRRR